MWSNFGGGPPGPPGPPGDSSAGALLELEDPTDPPGQGPNGLSVAGVASLSVNRINTGNVGGSKLVDVDPGALGLPDGVIVSVLSVGALFRFVRAPTAQLAAIVDARTVVASAVVAGAVWVRLIATTDERFGANPPKFVDPTLGNDDNDGLTAGVNALKTLDEWCLRMNGQTLTASVDVACAAGTAGNFSCRLGSSVAGVLVQIIGASTDSGPGTVSSIVAENSATNTEFQFSDTTGLGPVIADGDRIKITAGLAANIGATGYVKGFGAGGITNPFTGAFSTPLGATVFPAALDTYVVSTPTTIIKSVVVDWENQNPSNSNCTIQFVGIKSQGDRFTSYKIVGTGFVTNANFGITFLQSVFADDTLTNFVDCFFRAIGCDFKTAVQMNESKVTFKNPMFRLGLTVQTSARSEITGPGYFDGAGSLLNIVENGYMTSTTAAVCCSRGVASPSVPGVLVQAGGQLVTDQTYWSPVQGARNALTFGILVFEGGGIASNTFAAKNSIIGSTANIQIAGQTLTQFTVCLTAAAYCLGVTSGPGVAILSIHDIATAPSAPANVGEMIFGIAGATHARGLTSGLNTIIPAGRGRDERNAVLSEKKRAHHADRERCAGYATNAGPRGCRNFWHDR
jgi:hypothetical protein